MKKDVYNTEAKLLHSKLLKKTSRMDFTYRMSKWPSINEGQVEEGVSVLRPEEDESLMSDAVISES